MNMYTVPVYSTPPPFMGVVGARLASEGLVCALARGVEELLGGVGSRTHILRLAWLPLLLVPPLILCPKLLHHMSPLEGGVSLLMRFHVILQSPLLG